MAVSFDLFGTLVAVDRGDPAAAVGDALREQGVAVPADWRAAYRERHVDAPAGREVPLPAHVRAALASRGVTAPEARVARAVTAAFDPDVETLSGAARAVDAASARGPVAVLSNCSVPGLARRALARAAVPDECLDAVVTSVDVGWRKPDARAFEAAAAALDVSVEGLVHVGDDPETDGGSAAAGGRYVAIEAEGSARAGDGAGRRVATLASLASLPAWLEGSPCP